MAWTRIAEALSDQEVPTRNPTFVPLDAFTMGIETRMWSDRSFINGCEFITPIYLPFRKQKAIAVISAEHRELMPSRGVLSMGESPGEGLQFLQRPKFEMNTFILRDRLSLIPFDINHVLAIREIKSKLGTHRLGRL
jgi:hypothetical protein